MNTSWSDPNDLAVLEDQMLERGGRYPPLPPYTKSGDGDGGGGDGDGDGYDGDGYGDGGDGYGDGGEIGRAHV